MSKTLRKVEKQVDDNWIVISLKEVKEGDIFRMTEPGEDTPIGTWQAMSDAYKTPLSTENDIIWGVDAR